MRIAKPRLRKRRRARWTAGSRLLASHSRRMGSPVKIAHGVTSAMPNAVATDGDGCWNQTTSTIPSTIATARRT